MLIGSLVCTGETYYLDATHGDDNRNGLSPENAWQTIAAINRGWSIIQAGDSILFKRGEKFIGIRLDIRRGGTSENPLKISVYGNGPKPVISAYSGAISCREKDASHIIIKDIAIKNILGGQAISFNADNISCIRISGVDIDNVPNYNGILLYKVDTYLIEDCEISNCGNSCIAIMGSPTYPITNGIIRNNIISNAIEGDGITLHRSSDYPAGPNHWIEGNICYNNREQGIDINGGDNITLTGNETYRNGDSGILVDKWASRVLIEKHYSHDEMLMGIIINFSSDVKLINSIIYNMEYHALIIDGCRNFQGYNNTIIQGIKGRSSILDIKPGSRNIRFINNIIMTFQTPDASPSFRFLDGANPQNTSCDFRNNVWWRPDGISASFWWDEDSGRYDLNHWKFHYSQGEDSHFVDPRLNIEFNLEPDSPCIDAGIDVGIQMDYSGKKVPRGKAVDIGAFEFYPEKKETKSKR